MPRSRLFIDSPPIIYLIEGNQTFIEKVADFFEQSVKQDVNLYTSALTVAEIYIKPIKLKRTDLVAKFDKLLKTVLEVKSITWDIAELSATLRSRYTSLKAVDALQIACAIQTNCTGFVTNDRRLKFIKEIPILLVKDL
jgi:predicted nucleic acid-binding protein